MKKTAKILTASLISLASAPVFANNFSAVNLANCVKKIGTHDPFILVLKRGEPVTDSITRCASAAKIKAASINGIGSVEKPTIAFYNLDRKRYQYKNLLGNYELTSLNGNITLFDGKPFSHLHATLADEQYNVIGGHFNEAFVLGTVEITITPLKSPIVRTLDQNTGLNLISR